MQMIGTEHSEESAIYDFHAGTDTRAYDHLGVHPIAEDIYRFRVYAPTAHSAAVLGDMTEGKPIPMRCLGEGVWECDISADPSRLGEGYCFLLNGETEYPDPYARRRLRGDPRSSMICAESTYAWQDGAWMRERTDRDVPQNLYEVHLGSFATREGRSNIGGDAYLNYRELGDLLANYLSDMAYTHVKLMPLTEHARDGSHGYAANGYFAPTFRHGSPDDLRAMVDRLHEKSVGVMMDLPLGTDGETGEMWDVRCPEVQSFLLSAVFFWLREFHLDGIVLVGLGAWARAGREMHETAQCFLALLLSAVHAELPHVSVIAGEDIGTMTGEGGLGFDAVLHERWAGDMLRYLGAEPIRRECLCDLPRLLLHSAWNENYLLPFSHRSICAGRRSLWGQMHGSYLQKFHGVRLALAFQIVHPGKKLLFMGCELGQCRAWDDTVPPDWFLRDLEIHAQLLRYVRALNRFYLEERCLWQGEMMRLGLICPNMAGGNACLLAVQRVSLSGERLLAVFNFSAEPAACQCAAEGEACSYREVFRSDLSAFGGAERMCASREITPENGLLPLRIPAMTVIFLRAIFRDQIENFT